MGIQGTDEWLRSRVGKVTGSRTPDVMARTKKGWGASRENYKAELVVERITGMPYPSYVSTAMQWGIDHEAEGRAAYAFRTGVEEIVEVGLVPHPTIAMSGASPDGLVGQHGLVEIKCPNTSTHLETLLGGGPALEYLHQVQWQMACTGRRWCDLISYDPRVPERMRLYIYHVERDNKWIADMEEVVRGFLVEVEEMLERLQRAYPAAELPKGGGAAGQPQQPDATSPRQLNEPHAGGARRHWNELPPPTQAGILCTDPAFHTYLSAIGYPGIDSEEAAAECLRQILGVDSRADIAPGSAAHVLLRDLTDAFRTGYVP